MALNFPDSPTDGQKFVDATSGESWTYEAATNSWTSDGLTTSSGVKYRGGIDITAAPPAGVQPGWQYSVTTGGTPNAGFTGLSGNLPTGVLVLFDGTKWQKLAQDLTFTQAGTGAKARTIESKLRDVVSVKDFGAVGDGVTDDTAAIQAAIDYAESIATDSLFSGRGASVIFPSGVYKVSGLTIDEKNISLIGDARASVIQVVGTSAVTAINMPSQVWDCTIEGLTFQASSSSGTVNSTASVGIAAVKPSRLNIRNCDFFNLNSSIDFSGGFQSIISDCRFNQNTRSTAAAANSIKIAGVTGEAAPGGGIHIQNCEFTGSATVPTTAHIDVDGVDGLYISNSHLIHYLYGLRLAPTGTAPNDIIYSVMCDQVYFDEANSTGYNVVYAGTMSDTGSVGYHQYSNCMFRTANHNIYFNVTKSGSDTGRLRGIAFSGCRFQRPQKSHIFATVTSCRIEGLSIVGNNFYKANLDNSASNSPIVVNSTDNTISAVGNTFEAESNSVTNVWDIDTTANNFIHDGNNTFLSTGAQPAFTPLTLTVGNLTDQSTIAFRYHSTGGQVAFSLASIAGKTVTANGAITFSGIPEHLRPLYSSHFTFNGKYNDGTDKFGTCSIVINANGTGSIYSISTEGLYPVFTAGDVVTTQTITGSYPTKN